MVDKLKNATVLDVLVVLIISISITSISSLMLGVFNVNVCVLLGLNITLFVFGLKKDTWKISINMSSPHILPILMVLALGLLFRSEPYHYVAGGKIKACTLTCPNIMRTMAQYSLRIN